MKSPPRGPAKRAKTERRPSSIDALTLRAILGSAAAGIITIDAHGIMETANPAAQRMFGYDEDELIGANVSMLMPEPDRRQHDGYMERYLQTREPRIVGIGREVIGVRKDGSRFPMHLSVGEFATGGTTYFTGVLIDLTAQKSAERASVHQQALFRSIFESLPDPVLILDTERRIKLANPAFTQVFGYAEDSLTGRSSAAIYASDSEWQRHGRTDSATAEDSQSKTQVFRFRRADGQIFPGAAVRTEIRDAEGHDLGFLKVVRDISEDLRREAALMQASRMEAIGQLTGGIAHDFNNILTVILGNLELLEMRLDDAHQTSLAREAQEAAEMGARLTDRLLTFGRRQHLETESINLNAFVLGLMDILSRTLGEDIDLSTSLAGDLWPTEVDPGQVENAVLNLAINARDAMPVGGRLVIETRNVTLDDDAVTLTPELKPGDYVVLTVSDTGHGMPPDVRARAFEPFFSTKGPGKGSGLGLATIYGFVKQSGGHATIYSEIGRGTSVNIYLPRAHAADADDPADEARHPPLATGGELILVVEDDDRVRRLTCRRLQGLGYRVSEARNGQEALDILATSPGVELVFSDLVMPGGMSGIDLFHEISKRFPGTRTLLTSGYAEELVNAARIEGEFISVLRKPYRQADLAAAIRQSLG